VAGAARLARHRPFLRAGLLLMSAGSVLGLAYIAEKAVYVVTQAAHLPPPFASDQSCSSLLTPPQCAFSITLPVTAVLLAATGATLPVWGAALAAPFRYYRSRRTFRALQPLWERMREAFPQITLPDRDDGRRWDLTFRLYRRVIEIDDGRLRLHPYISPAVTAAAEEAATARGLHGDRLRATIEAAGIIAALDARHDYPPAPVAPVPSPAEHASGDVTREAAWLAKVARACTSSPVIRDLAATSK